MTAPGVVLDRRHGPFDSCLDAEAIRAFAAATKDPSPAARAATAVPPAAVVTQIWEAQNAGRRALVPEDLQRAATGGVHGEHDVVLHRPIRPGEPLTIWVEGQEARPAGRNGLVTLRYETLDADGSLVAEQWWTTVYLGVTCDRCGAPPPDHSFPEEARAHPAGDYTVDVDTDMARRYAQVSGDWSDHHFDMAAARRSGFDRPFLHGLCTMALCGQAVVEVVAGGDPEQVRRLAVRFATPTFRGEQLTVRLYEAGPRAYAFEAHAGGATVITHGRAELR
jgi:acyl dehydratase